MKRCPYCFAEMVDHVFEEGSRQHVTYWDTAGEHCTEPKCEKNHKCKVIYADSTSTIKTA